MQSNDRADIANRAPDAFFRISGINECGTMFTSESHEQQRGGVERIQDAPLSAREWLSRSMIAVEAPGWQGATKAYGM